MTSQLSLLVAEARRAELERVDASATSPRPARVISLLARAVGRKKGQR